MNYRSPLQNAYEDSPVPYQSRSYGNRYSPYPPNRNGVDHHRRPPPSSKDSPVPYQSRSYGNRYSPYPPNRNGVDHHRRPPPSRGDRPSSSHSSTAGDRWGDRPSSSHSSTAGDRYSKCFKSTKYPAELNIQFEATKCILCSVDLLSPIQGKMHYAGKPHIKKIKNYLTEWSLKTGNPMPKVDDPVVTNSCSWPDYCEICDVQMISTSDKVLHYSGKHHLKNLRDPANAKKKRKTYETLDLSDRFGIGECFAPLALKGEDPKMEIANYKPGFMCELCDVNAASQEQLTQHLNGKKHKEKLEKKLSGAEKKEKLYSCSLCSVSLDTKKLLYLHLEGKRHKKNVSKKEMAKIEEGIKANTPCQSCTFVGNLDNHVCGLALVEDNMESIGEKYICTICNCMMFENEKDFEEHNRSNSHILHALNNEQGEPVKEELSHWYCFLCKKQYQCGKSYTEHFFGEKHMRLSHNQPAETLQLFQCKVCELTLTPELHEQHLEDKQHIRKSIKDDSKKLLSDLANKDLPTMTYYCENCRTKPLNFLQYNEHMMGENHMVAMMNRQLLEIRRSKKFSSNK